MLYSGESVNIYNVPVFHAFQSLHESAQFAKCAARFG